MRAAVFARAILRGLGQLTCPAGRLMSVSNARPSGVVVV